VFLTQTFRSVSSFFFFTILHRLQSRMLQKNQTFFWSKWLRWKGRRETRLSNSGSFEQDLIFFVAEWSRYVKYFFTQLVILILFNQKNITFYSCFYAINCCVFISNTFSAKWLKWKGVRDASLSKRKKFEQELSLFGCTMTMVCEVFFTKLSVIFILLIQKNFTFYSCFYAIDFCVFISNTFSWFRISSFLFCYYLLKVCFDLKFDFVYINERLEKIGKRQWYLKFHFLIKVWFFIHILL